MSAPASWRCGPSLEIDLGAPVIMGILNATPDSFSDGGRPRDALIGHGLRMLEEGATILDVGGESTRPGAQRISAGEQIDRVVPVIEQLASSGAIISVDTTLGEVARAALDAGAVIVNDVSGGSDDPDLLVAAAERECGLVLMHRLHAPVDDRYSTAWEREPDYGTDVVAVVRESVMADAARAESVGVAPESIVIDPGLGFGKSVGQNFELMDRISALTAGRHAVLVGASRKSFIGAATGVEDPASRLAGSLAAAVAMAERGVRLFRVHDVAAHREALSVAAWIAGIRAPGGSATMTSTPS